MSSLAYDPPARGKAGVPRTPNAQVDVLAKAERRVAMLREQRDCLTAQALDMDNWSALQEESRDPETIAFLEGQK